VSSGNSLLDLFSRAVKETTSLHVKWVPDCASCEVVEKVLGCPGTTPVELNNAVKSIKSSFRATKDMSGVDITNRIIKGRGRTIGARVLCEQLSSHEERKVELLLSPKYHCELVS
jgi:hypothetical protein